MDKWISIADAMPHAQQMVDIAYVDHFGRPATTMGWYCPAKTLKSDDFADEVFLKEQWVDESQESEYHYPISGVTHWKPRAKHPDAERINEQAEGGGA